MKRKPPKGSPWDEAPRLLRVSPLGPAKPIIEIDPTRGNFTDYGFSPDESAVLGIKWRLMFALNKEIADRGLTQAEAATLLAVTQPRISNLKRGLIRQFTVDTLIALVARIGGNIELVVDTKSKMPLRRKSAPRRQR